MKIHQILPALDYGDAISNDVIETMRVLRKMGYESEIFAKYIHPKVAKYAKHIEQYKKSVDDIIIYHFSLAGFDVTDFVISLRCKKILIYHNITPHNYFKDINDELYNMCWQGRNELKKLSKEIKFVLGDSEYSRNELDDYGFVETDVLPILLDYSKYENLPNEKVVERYNDDYVNLLFVGRISPNKKQEDVIKTFYYYKKINPKSRLFLVGSYKSMEKYLNQLQELVARLNLTDVIFTGHISFEDMVAYYRMADVFLCMSEHEGFCVPLLESMYFNIPIIAYDSTAIPYTLGKSGVLVKKKRYDEIAEMVNLLISDDVLRERIVDGQVRRLKDFDTLVIEEKIKKCIDGVANSNKTTEKSVSVIICTYNRAKYLERCIESLKKQTYENFEIIVVNGPSTDDTSYILNKYHNIIVIRQNYLNGLSFARNLGIGASKGDIIAFIDDDAVADKDWLRCIVEEYSEELIGGIGGPVFDITGSAYQFKNGYISRSGIPSFINEKDLDYNNAKGDKFNYIMGTNSSFRKTVLYKIGMFDEKIRYYIDETDVCIRMIKLGYKIKHVDTAIVFHEMVEGYNRRSRYDLNWREIMKNVIYFTLKNFRGDLSSYTIRPIRSLCWWLENFYCAYRNKDISMKQLFDIYVKLVLGATKGYIDGLLSFKR